MGKYQTSSFIVSTFQVHLTYSCSIETVMVVLVYGSWIYNFLCNQCLSPLKLWVRNLFRRGVCNMSDNVCQWLAAGWWFSPGTSVSSTNKTDRHNITEILLKVALNITTLNLNVQFTSCNLSIFSAMAVYDMHKYLTKINTSSITDSYLPVQY
jgi:hypothetical protein